MTRPNCFGKYFNSQATECRYECSSPTLCCGQTGILLESEHNPYAKKSPANLAYSVIMLHTSKGDSSACTRDELQREVMAIARERSIDVNERTARWAVNRALRDLFKKGMVSMIPAQVILDIRVGVASVKREPVE